MRSIAGFPQEPRNPPRNGRKNEGLCSQIGATRSGCSSALLSLRPRSGTQSGRQRKGHSTAQNQQKDGPRRRISLQLSGTSKLLPIAGFLLNAWSTSPGRDIAAIDTIILTGVPDRTTKVQAPDPLKPTNRFAWPQGSIDHFVEGRAKTEEFLKSIPGLRDHAVRQPRRNEMACLRIHPFHRRAQRTPHQANSRSQSRSQLPQILITAAGRLAALCSGRLMRRGVPGVIFPLMLHLVHWDHGTVLFRP
jgi:hypothetical protein